MASNGRRRLVICCLMPLLACFFASFALAGTETLRVEIQPLVRINGDGCLLREIASFSGTSQLAKSVGAVILAPRGGVITREQVVAALRDSGLEGVRLELKMPATVRVEKTAAGPDNSPVALIKELASWNGDVEVEYDGSVPEGRLVSPASLVPGTAAVVLRFRDGAGRERPLSVRIKWLQNTLVLVRPLKRGALLRREDFTVRQVRVGSAGLYASRPEEVVGRSLRKGLAQGKPLLLDMLADVPLLAKGKKVTIVVHSGGLTVNAAGEALADAGLGSSVRVRNLASGAVVNAVVVSDDTVEVNVQ